MSEWVAAVALMLLAVPVSAIPLVDVSGDTRRQIVVDREPGQYLGHVTTVTLDDGNTIVAVYPKGHGRGAIVMKRSRDGGKTWSERLPTPENWATSLEVPTIYKVRDPGTRRTRLLLWSGLNPARIASSDDHGKTWTPLEPVGDWGGIVVMASLRQLPGGDILCWFHDDGRYLAKDGKRDGLFRLYQVRSADGGRTWSAPRELFQSKETNLCEPGLVVSPDGKRMALLLRENARVKNSHVAFSDDDGRTWSAPKELPPTLTGDRHTAAYLKDGRLFITFRDTAKSSPTAGDWVAWVGTWDDIANGRPGGYRVRLMDNTHDWDCAYPGLEVLRDGTIVTTTYGHWVESEEPYIVCLRLDPKELDRLARKAPTAAGASMDVTSLPVWSRPKAPPADWLVATQPAKAGVYRTSDGRGLVLANGLISRAFRLEPNLGTVALDNLMTGASMVRAVRPEACVTLDGTEYPIGGLTGQPDLAYLTDAWLDGMKPLPSAFRFAGFTVGRTEPPFAWKRVRHIEDRPWPPPGVRLTLRFEPPAGQAPGVVVDVVYEMYDGLPAYAKWLDVRNGAARPVRLNAFVSENLAMVEGESAVGSRDRWDLPNVTVASDYSFGGDDARNAGRVATWEEDPSYATQISYELKTPCVLKCAPPQGPNVDIAPGRAFTSFRTFVLVHDSTDRERVGLGVRRMYRTLAPWSTENPLMLHVTSTDPEVLRRAIDQCADVGFEMVIISFWSGLDMEDESAANIAKFREIHAYAKSKGVELGGYSLLASRRIDDANDVVNPKTGKPGGAIFGNSPCLLSEWGDAYFRKVTAFLDETGFDLLEHDGSYPGDVCASTNHPGHAGVADSQYRQWERIRDFYRRCRERGVYLNVPDWYLLCGSSKTAMGYRETNWSLPRAQQVIHARQNMYDGTWLKAPTMGWMMVPLVEYQGGGAAATIEPLKDHLDVYGAHLANCLGFGVQACYRGPRLYDSPETRALVKRWVDWFKAHRAILESDVIHLRRADARRLDGVLHVNPALKEKGLLVVYNPTESAVTETWTVPLRYTGLQGQARVRREGGKARRLDIGEDRAVRLSIRVEPRGMTWYVIE